MESRFLDGIGSFSPDPEEVGSLTHRCDAPTVRVGQYSFSSSKGQARIP